LSTNNLDFKGMIEANYNVLSNLEASIQAFFKKFEDVDTKIVEKETAFINAKQEFKTLIQDYKSTLDEARKDFNLALAKEQQEFIEIANSNTEKILKGKEEELREKLEQEEDKILLKTKTLLEAMEDFNSNINIKIADTIKNLPEELESQKDLYINKTLADIEKTSNTLKESIENYRKILEQELESYKNRLIEEVKECKYTLRESVEDVKEVAEDIKKENISLNKNRSNLEADYKKVNNNLEKVSKDTNNLIKGINNIKYTFIINKIYILLFSILNSLFILRIIVPQKWENNFLGNKTLWTLIIIASSLIVVAICDFIYRVIFPFLLSIWKKIFNLIFTSGEETEED
jgi:chromosome segregation ATPase